MVPAIDTLGRMAQFDRFFLYKLEGWNGHKFKLKTPSNGSYRIDPATVSMSYADAVALLSGMPGDWALGWHLRADAGMWFLDVDGCVDDAGVLQESGQAAWQFAAASGCLFEYSSSGRGVHVIGSGVLPPHGVRGAGFELYSADRGICFGRSGQAWGNAGVVATVPARWMLPVALGDANALGGLDQFALPVPGWDGPTDDAELRELMLRRRDASKVFTGGVTLRELLEGDRAAIARAWPEAADKDDGLCSDADAALAAHLAFYTGKHLPRMVRLLRESGLYRAKFDRDDYLERTCLFACRGTSEVYRKPAAPILPPVLPLPAVDPLRGIEAARLRIRQAGNGAELELACGHVSAMDSWSVTELAELRANVKKTADSLNIKLGAPEIKRLLPGTRAAVVHSGGTVGAPDWISEWMFEATSGRFYNLSSGKFTTIESARIMMRGNPDIPRKETGKQEDPIELFVDPAMWNGTRVDVMQYAPDQERTFTEYGTSYGNTYNPATVPEAGEPIPEDVAAVWGHLLKLCKGREDVAHELLYWIAWQVQRPGKQIRWAPLIIGRQGIGKGYLGTLLRAVCGPVNCKVVLPSDISNSGGFTDWAYGRAVTVLDEVHVSGMDKYAVYNRMKPYLSEPIVSINRKGSSSIDIRNTTNYMGFSNFDDSVPLDEDDRRWLVIRAPNLRLEHGEDVHKEYMGKLFDIALERAAGIRGWLMSVAIPASWPKTPMMTEDKRAMIDDGESSTVAMIKKYTRNGVFNITDSFGQIKADCLMTGEKVPTTTSLGKAAKNNMGMSMVRYVDSNRVEKRMYVSELILPFVPTARDAYKRWQEG